MDAIAIDLNFDLYQDKRKHNPDLKTLGEERSSVKQNNPVNDLLTFTRVHSSTGLNVGQFSPSFLGHEQGLHSMRQNHAGGFFRGQEEFISVRPRQETFVKMEIWEEDLPEPYVEGKIVCLSGKKYRSHRGLLYEVMEDIEESELV
jgi:hypothetical protein